MVEEMPMIEIDGVEPQDDREKNGEERRAPGGFRPDTDASPAMLGGVHHRFIVRLSTVKASRSVGDMLR